MNKRNAIVVFSLVGAAIVAIVLLGSSLFTELTKCTTTIHNGVCLVAKTPSDDPIAKGNVPLAPSPATAAETEVQPGPITIDRKLSTSDGLTGTKLYWKSAKLVGFEIHQSGYDILMAVEGYPDSKPSAVYLSHAAVWEMGHLDADPAMRYILVAKGS